MNFEDLYFPGKGKNIAILGVPLGFGAEHIGSELGITALRLSKIQGKRLAEHIQDLGYKVSDYGDLDIVLPTHIAEQSENPKYLNEIVQSCETIANGVEKVLENEEFPVIIGGDHSIAAGTFSGVSSFFRKQKKEVGLLWLDAHADMNTPETSITGNVHGMPLAALLGMGNKKMVNLKCFSPKLNPKYLAHVGGRDFDLAEKKLIRELGMREQFFTMDDIDKRGMPACIKDAIDIVSKAEGGFAVTFDVDVIDPRFAPGSGTLVRGGLTYREAHLALEMIAENGGMRSFEIVEVNPMLDEKNITVKLANELILSALGKTIL